MGVTEMIGDVCPEAARIGCFVPLSEWPKGHWAGFTIHQKEGFVPPSEKITIFCDPLLFMEHLRACFSTHSPGQILPREGYSALLRGSAASWWATLHSNTQAALRRAPFANFRKAFLERFLTEGEKLSFYNDKLFSLQHVLHSVKLVDWVDRKFVYGKSSVPGGEKVIAQHLLTWFDQEILEIIQDVVELYRGHMPFKTRLECERFCKQAQPLLNDEVKKWRKA